ncbi:YiaA/YiaB family inner membrane protein [Nocardioides sp.]|uniref:YiaA/YiaB family inner membrane protein n=1 Tax=Nocardioides sp. TaxID=35761 RepID=UPI003526E65D
MSTPTTPRNTNGFALQAGIAFVTALFAMILAIYLMDGDVWIRAFLALGTVFLVTSSFTLAKVVRDAQEETYVMARLDRARLDKLLSEHDPFQPQV